MAILAVQPDTVHRDWDDVEKFHGRPFAMYTYVADPECDEYSVTHRVEWAQLAATGPTGSPLDPVTRYLAVKNYGPNPILLYLNTVLNWPNPAFEVTILPGHWVEFVDLDPTTQPRIRTDSAVYSTPTECEILEIGDLVWEEEQPDPKCDMWAVGHYNADSVGAKHYPEGGVWATVVTGIAEQENAWFADVAGVAVTDYWAVGYRTAGEPLVPVTGLFAKWDGAAWAENDPEGQPPMYGDWGFATDNYWAVGGLMVGEIWHWAGGPLWVQDYALEQDERIFRAVHGYDPLDVWAVGDVGLVSRYNGIAWDTITYQCPTQANLYGVWAANSNDVWICGGDQAWWGASGGNGVIFRLMGGLWIPQVLPPEIPTLRAIWGFATDDIWAVGDWGTILHWDGFTWNLVAEPLETNYDYRGVFGCYPWSVWAIGVEPGMSNAIIQWDGVSWNVVHGPNAGEMDLLGLKGVKIL